MFDFEKLSVYSKATEFVKLTRSSLLSMSHLDRSTKSQLNRAALSIILNIAEGSGRLTKPDKRHFYVIARGSVFECAALFNFLEEEGSLQKDTYQILYTQSEELSKMLFSMIKNLQ